MRGKKIRQLESEASKCRQLTEMFASGSSAVTAGSSKFGGDACSSESQTAVQDEAEAEAAAAAQGQIDEGQMHELVEVPQTSAGHVCMKGGKLGLLAR